MTIRLVFTLCLFTCSTASWASEKLTVNPHLYRVTKSGVSSYIFGTLHIGLSLSDLPDYLLDELGKGSLVYSEISIETSNDFVQVIEDYKRIVVEDKSYPCPILEKKNEEAKQIRDLLAVGVPKALTSCNTAKLELPAPTIVIFAAYMFRANPKMLLDQEINVVLAKRGLQIVRLETDEFLQQVKEKVALRLGPDAEEKPLDLRSLYTLPTLQYLKSEGHKVVAEYLSGDINEYLEDYNYEKEDYGVVLRNSHWAEKVLPHAEKEPISIVVGVAHLYGPPGLLEHFRQKGFTIERYPLED